MLLHNDRGGKGKQREPGWGAEPVKAGKGGSPAGWGQFHGRASMFGQDRPLAIAGPSKKNASIVIVEPDPDCSKLFKDLLEANGHSVVATSGFDEALASVRERKPDMLFSTYMDYSAIVPAMVAAVRRESPGTKVVIVTGLDLTLEKCAELLDIGISGVVKKPVGTKTLADVVDQCTSEGFCGTINLAKRLAPSEEAGLRYRAEMLLLHGTATEKKEIRILLVSPNGDVLQAVKSDLESDGFTVVAGKDTVEALTQKNAYDISAALVIDPDGGESIKMLLGKSYPLVVWDSMMGDLMRRVLLNYGVDEVVTCISPDDAKLAVLKAYLRAQKAGSAHQ